MSTEQISVTPRVIYRVYTGSPCTVALHDTRHYAIVTITNRYDAYGSINAKLQFARGETTIIIGKSWDRLDSAKKGWAAVVTGATPTLQPPTIVGEYRAMAAAVATVPVSETHFQFNAIVQNQLPRSWRNIREKFTAESVLLARHRPNLSRTIPILDPRDFNSRNYSHLGCRRARPRIRLSQNRRETPVETVALDNRDDDYAIPTSLSLYR